ncbi:hypothetical protein BV898_19834 [Hypsibius exemplaris]|uniref:Uncharacterized protein n=1 Tax=Hypsibius exemplaris TaxID=2072580 RepID=A0A9X6RPV1_HYPEX|nr:hypothetical protein BV898_19834 [Hypsibius exemplaris]
MNLVRVAAVDDIEERASGKSFSTAHNKHDTSSREHSQTPSQKFWERRPTSVLQAHLVQARMNDRIKNFRDCVPPLNNRG